VVSPPQALGGIAITPINRPSRDGDNPGSMVTMKYIKLRELDVSRIGFGAMTAARRASAPR
jgi:hypothetical protein